MTGASDWAHAIMLALKATLDKQWAEYLEGCLVVEDEQEEI